MNTITPYNDARSKKEQVEEMFDNIAHRYDFLNHLLSLGIDIIWRKKAVKYIGTTQPKKILDVASGTGDFAFEALSLHPEKIIGFGKPIIPNLEHLWETTLNPKTRRLLRVEISDALATDRIINELMGKDASARFRFIMERAEEADELDV